MRILVTVFLLCTFSATFVFAADLDKGKQSYSLRCSSCHGISGTGDGPVARSLPTGMVANLVNGPFKVTQDFGKLREVIKNGGAALGLNAMMPSASDLSEEDLEDLTSFVWSLRK